VDKIKFTVGMFDLDKQHSAQRALLPCTDITHASRPTCSYAACATATAGKDFRGNAVPEVSINGAEATTGIRHLVPWARVKFALACMSPWQHNRRRWRQAPLFSSFLSVRIQNWITETLALACLHIDIYTAAPF
jgi:hypothetical protein